MQGQDDEKSSVIVLEEDNLRVVIDPHQGGKSRSFCSHRTGIKYLYQDSRASFMPGTGYGSHDISGFDECFSTVLPCTPPDGPRQGLELAITDCSGNNRANRKLLMARSPCSVLFPSCVVIFNARVNLFRVLL